MKQNKKATGAIKILTMFGKGTGKYFAIAVIATFFSVVFNFLMPRVISITVDSVIGDKPFALPNFIVDIINQFGGRETLVNNLIICAAVGLAFSILSGIFNFICRMATTKAAESNIMRMRNFLFHHIQKLPYSWHIKTQTGDTIQRCTSDMDVVRNLLAGQLLEIVRTIFLVVLAMILMFQMNVKLSLIALLFMPIAFAYSGFFYGKIAKKFKYADEAEGALSVTAQENFTGVRVVRAFGREAHEMNKFAEKNNDFANFWIKLGRLMGLYWGVGDLVSGLQVFAIMILGIIEAVNGNITLGEFMLFVAYNQMLVWPIRGLGRILSEASKSSVSLNRIGEIIDVEEETDAYDAATPPMNADIEFKNVTFSYGNLEPVLKNVSFKIKAGTTFGILGATGSGKSTLMHLLNRLYDLEDGNGVITIGGVDIKNIKLDYLRRNIGLVLQEPFLFSKTIKENLMVANKSMSLEEIRKLAAVAAIDDAINEFADGYETVVGERGVTLSGGQKQRVAITRTLAQKSPIMVFDDSLSAVDTQTDAHIRSSLAKQTSGITTVLIAHRITTIMNAETILVLDNGCVSEIGNHGQLIENGGIYKRIFNIQENLEEELNQLPQSKQEVGGEA